MAKNKLSRIAISVLIPIGAFFVVYWAVFVKAPIPCTFYLATGFYCPACGGTRAVISLFHGDILNALKSNAVITLCAIPAAVFIIRIWLGAAFNKPEYLKFGKKAIIAISVFTAALILFGIIRNIPTEPFLSLNP